jgi:hypothetical protein
MSSTSDPGAPFQGARANVWIAFAAIVLFIAGAFSVLYGLAAILNDQQVANIGSGHGVVVWDTTAWGWISLIVGAIQILTAMGLYSGSSVSRILAIVFATISALTQFGIVTAFPLWSLLVVALDLIVIYQLAVNWDERT